MPARRIHPAEESMSRAGLTSAVAAVTILVAAWLITERAPSLAAGSGEVRPTTPIASSGPSVTIKVPQGADGGAIARQLERAGVVSGGGMFGTLAGLMGVQNELAAGEYEFSPGLPASELIQRLRKGIVVPTVTVTIPEGRRLEEVAALFERQGLTTAAEFQAAAAATDYPQAAAQNRPQGATLEGYLFPDTYFFTKKITAHDIVERLVTTFEERFDQELRTAAQAQNLTVHQVATLASIVEREAQVSEERGLIAAVFINRLKAGIPLQADPTVQYAIADPASVGKNGWWKRDLTLDDLKVNSPYSTYANMGLPPGPIASAGLASLRAVAHPAPVKYLYFVAKGDGSHAFAETLDEHNRNVQKYQR
jgi:UPF0755 protein